MYVKQFGCDNIDKFCLIDMTPKIVTDENWKLGLYGGSFWAPYILFFGTLRYFCIMYHTFKLITKKALKNKSITDFTR